MVANARLPASGHYSLATAAELFGNRWVMMDQDQDDDLINEMCKQDTEFVVRVLHWIAAALIFGFALWAFNKALEAI